MNSTTGSSISTVAEAIYNFGAIMLITDQTILLINIKEFN